MPKSNHPLEKLVKTITYKGVDFEVVERPDVIWVGCVDYASNNESESDINATLKRYQALCESAPKQEIINPGWSAALSINYKSSDKPRGMMFANECYTNNQDKGYDIFTQPGGLWLRVCNDATAAALIGFDNSEPFNPWKFGAYMYFAKDRILQSVAEENGYEQNSDMHLEIEYHCDAEYDTPPHTNYAYIPIIEK